MGRGITVETLHPGITPTTQDERTIALLAHMLQIMLWWIAPLAILIIKRDSRFVSFHALQALLLQAVYVLTIIGGLVLAFGVFVLTAMLAPEGNHGLPPGFYFLMPVLWLSVMGMGVVVLLAGIVYGVKAGRGEWAEYPYLGRLARRMLKLGPVGSLQQ